MSNQWRDQAERFISDGAVDHLRHTVSQIFPNRKNILTEFQSGYQDIVNVTNRARLLSLLEYYADQYSTFLFPAILTERSAPNFWLLGERNEPNEQEAWKMIYLLLSSVRVGDVLMNLDNIDEEGRIAWRRQLVSEDPSQFFHGIRSELSIRSTNWGTFFTALLAISYFTYRLRHTINQSELGLEEYFDILHEQYNIREDTSLIIFQVGKRQKREIHYSCKLNAFISKWFRGYIEGEENVPSLLTFLDSLTTIQSKKSKNLKVIYPLREKLTFYLLKHNQINGDILTKLITLKIQDSLNSKKPSGIYAAKQFFAKLSN